MATSLNEKIHNSSMKLRNNIKARSIFREIDRNTYKDFNKIITISNKIVSHLRDGSNINKEFKKSNKDYMRITHDIMNKTIYSDSKDLNNKRLLFENNEKDKKESKNINFLIRALRANIFPSEKNKKKKSSILEYYKENYIKKNLEIMKEKKNENFSVEDIRKRNIKNFTIKLIQDKKKLTRNINNYLNLTQSFINLPRRNILSSRTQEKIINLNINKIKNEIDMLNYNKKIQNKTKKKDAVMPYIKYEKLLRFSRSCFNIKKNNKTFNKSDIDYFYNQDDVKKSLSNTSYVVKDLLKSYRDYSNKFDKKEKLFNTLIKNSLPKIDDYDLIINKVIENQKQNQLKSMNCKKITEKKRENEIKNENKFYNAMNNIYNEQIIKWQKEDELKKIKLKIEDKKLKSNKTFIREIERNKRFISRFSDPYSERIGYNNVLEDFSNILGKNLYSKEDLFYLTKNYFNNNRKKENESKEEIEKQFFERKFYNENKINLNLSESDTINDNGKDKNGNDINIKLGYKSDKYISPITKDQRLFNFDVNYYQDFLNAKKSLEEKQIKKN